jgi:hypothetical protein
VGPRRVALTPARCLGPKAQVASRKPAPSPQPLPDMKSLVAGRPVVSGCGWRGFYRRVSWETGPNRVLGGGVPGRLDVRLQARIPAFERRPQVIIERGFPRLETPSQFPSEGPCFLGDPEDSRPARVREFPGGSTSHRSSVRLNIIRHAAELIQLHSHFLVPADRSQGSCLGSMSRDQYDQWQASHTKLPHISESGSWTTRFANATSWNPTTPSTDAMRRCGRTSSSGGPSG